MLTERGLEGSPHRERRADALVGVLGELSPSRSTSCHSESPAATARSPHRGPATRRSRAARRARAGQLATPGGRSRKRQGRRAEQHGVGKMEGQSLKAKLVVSTRLLFSSWLARPLATREWRATWTLPITRFTRLRAGIDPSPLTQVSRQAGLRRVGWHMLGHSIASVSAAVVVSQVRPCRTSSQQERTPWSSLGLSESIRSNTRCAAASCPRRHRHRP